MIFNALSNIITSCISIVVFLPFKGIVFWVFFLRGRGRHTDGPTDGRLVQPDSEEADVH